MDKRYNLLRQRIFFSSIRGFIIATAKKSLFWFLHKALSSLSTWCIRFDQLKDQTIKSMEIFFFFLLRRQKDLGPEVTSTDVSNWSHTIRYETNWRWQKTRKQWKIIYFLKDIDRCNFGCFCCSFIFFFFFLRLPKSVRYGRRRTADDFLNRIHNFLKISSSFSLWKGHVRRNRKVEWLQDGNVFKMKSQCTLRHYWNWGWTKVKILHLLDGKERNKSAEAKNPLKACFDMINVIKFPSTSTLWWIINKNLNALLSHLIIFSSSSVVVVFCTFMSAKW